MLVTGTDTAVEGAVEREAVPEANVVELVLWSTQALEGVIEARMPSPPARLPACLSGPRPRAGGVRAQI